MKISDAGDHGKWVQKCNKTFIFSHTYAQHPVYILSAPLIHLLKIVSYIRTTLLGKKPERIARKLDSNC
jgi:hypothetical protein